MTTPRQHHVVAQCILWNFTDRNGQLHVVDKRMKRPAVVRLPPGKAFRERDLNTAIGRDGSRNVDLEKWYADLEGEVKPLLGRMIVGAMMGSGPRLNQAEHDLWTLFFYHQHKRAADFFDRMGIGENVQAAVAETFDAAEAAGRVFSAEEVVEWREGTVVRRVTQNATVQARGRTSEEALQALRQKGLAFAVSPADRPFVIGDHAHVRRGGHLLDFRAEMWFPISSRVAVSPYGSAGYEYVTQFSVEQATHFNLLVLSQSNVVAGCSMAAMENLLNPKLW